VSGCFEFTLKQKQQASHLLFKPTTIKWIIHYKSSILLLKNIKFASHNL